MGIFCKTCWEKSDLQGSLILSFSLAPPCRPWAGFVWLHPSDHFWSLKWSQVNQSNFFFFSSHANQNTILNSFYSQENGSVHSNHPVFVHKQVKRWAMKLMESRKECEWRAGLLCLQYRWEKCCQVLEHTKGNRSTIYEWTRQVSSVLINAFHLMRKILFYLNYIILSIVYCSLPSVLHRSNLLWSVFLLKFWWLQHLSFIHTLQLNNTLEQCVCPGESLLWYSAKNMPNKFISITIHVPCVSTLIWFQRYLS